MELSRLNQVKRDWEDAKDFCATPAGRYLLALGEFVTQPHCQSEDYSNDTWYTKERFCEIYPIIKPGSFSPFIRFDSSIDKFFRWSESQQATVINPRLFFRFVYNNAHTCKVLCNRLQKVDWYGFVRV